MSIPAGMTMRRPGGIPRTALAVAMLASCWIRPAYEQTASAPNASTPSTPTQYSHRGIQDPSVDDILAALTSKSGSLNGTSRGIRAVSPHQATSMDLNLVFQAGSASLTQQAMGTLEKLGKALEDPGLAGCHFRIEGHTDTVGTPEQNKALSRARAESVAAFLERQFGVAPDRLEPVGVGEEGLPVPTPDQTAEPRNRVVRIINLGPAQN